MRPKVNPIMIETSILLVLFWILATCPFALAETRISGSITEDQTWTTDGNPYYLDGTVTFYSKDETLVTLTIQAGVEIRGYHIPGTASGGTSRLNIADNAAIVIQGQPGSEVLFTRTFDEGADEAYWARIEIEETARGSDCVINYAIFEYGAHYGGGMLYVNRNQTPLISNCIFRNSEEYGVEVNLGNMTLNNCQFINNEKAGVLIRDSYESQISNCIFNESNANPGVILQDAFVTWDSNTGADNLQYIEIDPYGWLTESGMFTVPGILPNGKSIPYILDGTVEFGNDEKDITLTIGPGVEFHGYHKPDTASGGTSKLYIKDNAALKIMGESGKEVLFTKTNLFGEEYAYWDAIEIDVLSRGADCQIKYAVFEYGGQHNSGMLRIENPAATIVSNTVFQYSESDGVYVDEGNAIFNQCRFIDNEGSSIRFEDSYGSQINNCSFEESKTHEAVLLRRAYPVWNNNTAIDDLHYILIAPNATLKESGTLGYPGNLLNGSPIPYVLYRTIVFSNSEKDITLIVEPSVEILGYHHPNTASEGISKLKIEDNAALKLMGLPGNEVKFSSTDFWGEDNAYWGSIYIDSNARLSDCVLNNTIFENGGSGYDGMLHIDNPGIINLNNLIFQNSIKYSIRLEGGVQVEITDTQFLNSKDHAVYCDDDIGSVTIHSSIFSNNEKNSVYNEGKVCVNAQFNYWGDPTGPLDDSDADDCVKTQNYTYFNPDGKGNPVSDYVIYSPWTYSKMPCVCEDSDKDGVPDAWDQCPGTSQNALTDRFGCFRKEMLDVNGDGIFNLPDIIQGLQILSN